MQSLGEWPFVISVIMAVIATASFVRMGFRDVLEHIDNKFKDAEETHKREALAFREMLQSTYVSRDDCDRCMKDQERFLITRMIDSERAYALKLTPSQSTRSSD